MRNSIATFSLLLGVLVSASPSSYAGGASSTSYEIGPGGSIERTVTTPDGKVVEVVLKGPQKCSNLTVSLDAAAISKLASLVPMAASVTGMSAFSNQDANAPLVVLGTPVSYTPSAAVSAEAQNFFPAPPGFVWRGFQSNVVNGTFQPGDFVEFFLKVNYANYPAPADIGTHMGAVYVSDNAQSVQPIVMSFPVYVPIIPTVTEVGLVVLATLLVGGGAWMLNRGGRKGPSLGAA